MPSEASKEQGTQRTTRRSLLVWISAAGSAVIGAMMVVPGAAYVLDPILRARDKKGRFIRVAELASLSREHPVSVPVIGEQVDAWTKASDTRLGTVWLRVLPSPQGDKVAAWNAECPHLGCKVGYQAEKSCFACPCHDSAFTLEGEVQGGPAPRSLDPLETRVVDGQVEVRFQRFRAQVKERVELDG
jgi:menaquinol-cytochrome c reductase iron-sulfur subunit